MNDLKEFEAIIEAINNLKENNAKALLKITYGFVNTAMTGTGGDEAKLEVVNKLADIYKELPR